MLRDILKIIPLVVAVLTFIGAALAFLLRGGSLSFLEAVFGTIMMTFLAWFFSMMVSEFFIAIIDDIFRRKHTLTITVAPYSGDTPVFTYDTQGQKHFTRGGQFFQLIAKTGTYSKGAVIIELESGCGVAVALDFVRDIARTHFGEMEGKW